MTLPILVEQKDGVFTASVLGSPAMSAAGATKDAAVAAVAARFRAGVAAGEVVLMDVPDPAFVDISGMAGKYKDDPTLREICEEAYRLRDAEFGDADRP